MVQIQPRENVLDHAGYTAPDGQHELPCIIHVRNPSALKGLDHLVGTDHADHTDHTDHTDPLSEVWNASSVE